MQQVVTTCSCKKNEQCPPFRETVIVVNRVVLPLDRAANRVSSTQCVVFFTLIVFKLSYRSVAALRMLLGQNSNLWALGNFSLPCPLKSVVYTPFLVFSLSVIANRIIFGKLLWHRMCLSLLFSKFATVVFFL